MPSVFALRAFKTEVVAVDLGGMECHDPQGQGSAGKAMRLAGLTYPRFSSVTEMSARNVEAPVWHAASKHRKSLIFVTSLAWSAIAYLTHLENLFGQGRRLVRPVQKQAQ